MTDDRPTAVIVDVDGTLVDVRSTRQHVLGPKKNFDAFHRESLKCPPIPETIDWVWQQYRKGHVILVVTARKYQWEEGTRMWCWANMPCQYLGPYMRGDDDNRPDTEVKQDIFDIISEEFRVVAAIDDNPNVIALWESLGLEVTTVAGWDEQVAAAYIEEANKEKS